MNLLRRTLVSRSLGALGALVAFSAVSCNDFDTTRKAPPKATLGDDMYGIFCDRVGASSIPEDLTGASYRSICHYDDKGKYGDEVDVSALPPPGSAKQKEARRLSVAKLETMARRRGDLVRAINAIFPADAEIPDIVSKEPGKTIRLNDALADFAQTLTPLYETNPYDEKGDPLFPTTTRAMARLFDAIAKSEAAREAMSRIGGRRGYRPFQIGLGAIRPALAYPKLRDLTTGLLRVAGPDGTAVPELQQLLKVAKQEFITSKPVLAPLPAFQMLDDDAGAPNRERSAIEFTAALMLAEDDAFQAPGEPPRYIALRDRRGFISVGAPGVQGSIPAPFSDLDGDGFADVDPFGRFIDAAGSPVPVEAPFEIPGVTTFTPDGFGRLPSAPYNYLDTSRTTTAAIARHLLPLVDPTHAASEGDPAPWNSEHETLMYALAGAYTLYGPRETAEYDYVAEAPDDQKGRAQKVTYQRFRAEDSPIPDLLHAAGQVVADKDSDVILLSLIDLFENHEQTMARLMGAALKLREIAKQHDELAAAGQEPKAELPYTTPIWDEMAQVVARVTQEPGLTAKLLEALASDAIVTPRGSSQHMGDTISTFVANRDELSYDQCNINGPSVNVTDNKGQKCGGSVLDPHNPVDHNKPKTGTNRSCLQRSLQIIHDANGGPACNKAGAEIPITSVISWPIGSSYKECELFQFDNLASFYLDTLLPLDHPKRSPLTIKDSTLQSIIDLGSYVGIDPNSLFESLSGIDGMTLYPEPSALNRLVFFGASSDLYPSMPDHDFVNDDGTVDTFIRSTIEPVSVASCPPDAKGVPYCVDKGGTLRVRDPNTIFLWERLGFSDYLQPMVIAFANNACTPDVSSCDSSDITGEKIFIDLIELLWRHWTGKDHGPECTNKKGSKDYCSEAGVSTYEPILAEAFKTDLIPALHEFAKVAAELQTVTVRRGPNKGQVWTGAQVLEKVTQILFDPKYAASVGMVDRKGSASTTWVDGTPQAQLTVFTLFADALHKIDTRFDTACDCSGKTGAEADACNANFNACRADADARRQQWKRARSQLVDEFMAVDGSGLNAQFRNKAMPKTVAQLLKLARVQVNAHCPDREAGVPCDWARKELGDKLASTIGGPTFAALMDVQEKIRQDEGARRELEQFLRCGLGAADEPCKGFDGGVAVQAMLASMSDIQQVLSDDGNLSLIFNAISDMASPADDADGPGAADTTLKVLKATLDEKYDRYHVIDHVLPNLVTPMDGGLNVTPIEVILDVIADVNRVDASVQDPLNPGDYEAIMGTVRDFMTDETRGLEQIYTIVKNRPRP